MSLQLALLLDMWLAVAYLSIVFCLLKPVVVQAVPAYSLSIASVKFVSIVLSYGRKTDYGTSYER